MSSNSGISHEITKLQFQRDYNKHSGRDCFSDGLIVAMPCNCGDVDCRGWAAVYNNYIDIHLHIDLTLYRMGNPSRLHLLNYRPWFH